VPIWQPLFTSLGGPKCINDGPYIVVGTPVATDYSAQSSFRTIYLVGISPLANPNAPSSTFFLGSS
jgi:hypothetical protein